MSKVPQHMIDEAAMRGIVPGAVIRCVLRPELTGLVDPYNEWTFHTTHIHVGVKGGCLLNAIRNGEWATVITPATSKEPEGLKEGDSCECGPAMRAAIVELAKELGVPGTDNNPAYPVVIHEGGRIDLCFQPYKGIRHKLAPETFIAKLRVTASKPKPIKIGGHTVDFLANGDIKVGCTRVDFATLDAVYNKAKATKP